MTKAKVRETYIKRVKQEAHQPLSFTDFARKRRLEKNQREERITEGRTTLSPTLPGTDIQRVHLRRVSQFFFNYSAYLSPEPTNNLSFPSVFLFFITHGLACTIATRQ